MDLLKSLDLFEATLDGLIEVTFHAQAIGELHVPSIYVSAPGRREPTRTPSTAHLLCLPFFAFLVAGLPIGLDATSSARSS